MAEITIQAPLADGAHPGEPLRQLAALWHETFAAFQGAFDNPVARRKHDDELAQDARRRLREFNEALQRLIPAQEKPRTEGAAPALEEEDPVRAAGRRFAVGDEVADSPRGRGRITGFSPRGFPCVNEVTVAWLQRADGACFDPWKTRHKASRTPA